MSEKDRSAWGANILPLLPGAIKVTNMGGGFYQLDFPAIAQTGANVKSTFVIPFPHILQALYVKQVDANLVDAVGGDTQVFSAKFLLRLSFQFALAAFTSDAADEVFLFEGSEGAHNATSYEFNTNADNGHFVFITMMVQALGEI